MAGYPAARRAVTGSGSGAQHASPKDLQGGQSQQNAFVPRRFSYDKVVQDAEKPAGARKAVVSAELTIQNENAILLRKGVIMKLVEQWKELLQSSDVPKKYWDEYLAKEKSFYAALLKTYESGNTIHVETSIERLAKAYALEPVQALGLLDGINDSLVKSLDLDGIDEGSAVAFDVDLERLYLEMHKVKANWLYGLDEWEQVLSADKRKSIKLEYAESVRAKTQKIVGRNDPCPCGSGKKYKKCCGKGGAEEIEMDAESASVEEEKAPVKKVRKASSADKEEKSEEKPKKTVSKTSKKSEEAAVPAKKTATKKVAELVEGGTEKKAKKTTVKASSTSERKVKDATQKKVVEKKTRKKV